LSQEDVGLWTAKKIQELRDEKALVEDQLVVEENVCAIVCIVVRHELRADAN